MSNLVTKSGAAIAVILIAMAASLIWLVAALGFGDEAGAAAPQMADDTIVVVDGVEVAWDEVSAKVDVADIVFAADNG